MKLKHIFILGALLFLQACASPKRAGSYYDPEVFRNFPEQNQALISVDQSEAVYGFHSALNNFCTQYYHENELYMACDNGDEKKMVPILQ